MKKIVRLTETDLLRIVKRVISEDSLTPKSKKLKEIIKKKFGIDLTGKIKEINIIYKLPDYPNLEFIGEDSTNSTFIFIEKDLSKMYFLPLKNPFGFLIPI